MYFHTISGAVSRPITIRGCHGCPAYLHGLCGSLNDDELGMLRQSGTIRRLPADTIVTHDGDLVREVMSVVKGVLRLSHLLPDGRRQIAAFAFPGDFLGLPFEARHHFAIETVTEAELCVVPRQRFEDFVQANPRVAAPLYATAVRELGRARDHLVLLGRKSAGERVATFLLQMAERTNQAGDGSLRAVLPMSRTDIADHLGLRIETVCRELTILKATDQVEIDRLQEVLIIDSDSLHDLANGMREGGAFQ